MKNKDLFNEWKEVRKPGYEEPFPMPGEDDDGIPCDKRFRYDQIMSKYQPPENVRWRDNAMEPEMRDSTIQAILEKYRNPAIGVR